MKPLNLLLKFQQETIGCDENEFLTQKNEIDSYHAKLLQKIEKDEKLNPFEKIYTKTSQGPWFSILSPFIMMLMKKQWNEIKNPENYEDRRRDLDEY